MSEDSNKRVLIAGDTPRWRKDVRDALPADCDTVTRVDYIDTMHLLFNENIRFDLYILASQMSEKGEGLSILSEMRDDGIISPVIIFSDHVTDAEAERITALNAIHIKRSGGRTALEETAKRLLS
jgi:DNA-binding NtrC family response regulator